MDKQTFETTLKTVLIDICQRLGILYDNETLVHLEEKIELFNSDIYYAYISYVKAWTAYSELQNKNPKPDSKEANETLALLDNSKKSLDWIVEQYKIRVNWSRVQKIKGIVSYMIENDPDNTQGPSWSHWTLGYSDKTDFSLQKQKGMYWQIEAGEAIPIIQFFQKKKMVIDEGRPATDLSKVNFIFVFRNS